MAYITREDGEHFVIPSYRDVITVTQKKQLKSELRSLSQHYGENVTLQEKSPNQFEIAFSNEKGYLFGESIWEYFKKPQDLIYCEAIPDTTEAYLVIVKKGSVYLDGNFSTDSIADELVVFLTQENHFHIFTFGNVPISQFSADGKFTFEERAVESFQVLEAPVFANLPRYPQYELQPLDAVLKAHGIGVFPIKPIVIGVVCVVVFWLGWGYLSANWEAAQKVEAVVAPDPYLSYYSQLTTAEPADEIKQLVNIVGQISTIPGWQLKTVVDTKGVILFKMISYGGSIADLSLWAASHGMTMQVTRDGVALGSIILLPPRQKITVIYAISDVILELGERLRVINFPNLMRFGTDAKVGSYKKTEVKLQLANVLLDDITMIAEELRGLPVDMTTSTLDVGENGDLTGTIAFEILGD